MRRKLILSLLVAVPLTASADGPFTFTTDPQTLAPGVVSGAITVEAASPVGQTTCLLLSSESATGQFSSSATNWSPVSAVTMSKNSSNRTFFYKDSTEGTYVITVRAAPKPDSVSSSCTSWADAAANVQWSATQSITIGSGGTTKTQTPVQTQSTTTQTQTQAQTTGGVGPPALGAQITVSTPAVVGAGTVFQGEAESAQGEPLISGVRYIWNFGDGATAEGARVLHTYAYPGDYDVQLSVSYNYSSGSARLALEAVPAAVSLFAEGDGSLTVGNNSSGDLDVGLWSLAQGSSTPFVIPEDTIVMYGKGVRFSPAVLQFMGGTGAVLYYPNGAVAATAVAGKTSPLRGEQVEMAPVQIISNKAPASPPAPIVKSTDQAAAVAVADPAAKEVEWVYLVSLAAVIALGAVGAYYAYTPSPAVETDADVEEFEIE